MTDEAPMRRRTWRELRADVRRRSPLNRWSLAGSVVGWLIGFACGQLWACSTYREEVKQTQASLAQTQQELAQTAQALEQTRLLGEARDFLRLQSATDRDRLNALFPLGWRYIFVSGSGAVVSEPPMNLPGVSWDVEGLATQPSGKKGVKFRTLALGSISFTGLVVGQVDGGLPDGLIVLAQPRNEMRPGQSTPFAVTLCGQGLTSSLDGELVILGVQPGWTNCKGTSQEGYVGPKEGATWRQ